MQTREGGRKTKEEWERREKGDKRRDLQTSE